MKSEPLYVFMQPQSRNCYWTNNIREGIRNAAKQWQDVICTLDLISAETLPILTNLPVLVVGNDSRWLENALSQLMSRGAQPVVVNASMLPGRRFRCSGVVFELEEMMLHCIEMLRRSGHKHTVLLGVNPASVTDKVKCDFFAYPEEVVWAAGRLDDCVTEFIQTLHEKNYDSVICANDTVAICLIRHLLERGFSLPEDLYIIGMGNSYVGEKLRVPLTSIMFNYYEMGEMAVQLYHNIKNNRIPCHMMVSLPCHLVVRESAPLYSSVSDSQALPMMREGENQYFESSEVQDIISMEAVLQACDETDREILFGLAKGESCEEIAERLYFSSRAVRYRIKNLVQKCGFSSRLSLETVLKKTILFAIDDCAEQTRD